MLKFIRINLVYIRAFSKKNTLGAMCDWASGGTFPEYHEKNRTIPNQDKYVSSQQNKKQ